jgi:hypothetical protein
VLCAAAACCVLLLLLLDSTLTTHIATPSFASYRVLVLVLECGALLCAQILHVELCSAPCTATPSDKSSGKLSSRNQSSGNQCSGGEALQLLPPLKWLHDRPCAKLATFHPLSPRLAMEYHLTYHWHIPTHLNHLVFGTR